MRLTALYLRKPLRKGGPRCWVAVWSRPGRVNHVPLPLDASATYGQALAYAETHPNAAPTDAWLAERARPLPKDGK